MPGTRCACKLPRGHPGGRESSGPPSGQGQPSIVKNTGPPHHPQGFSDERHGDVVVVRPMREHTLKEVAFYNHLFAVPSVCTPALDTKVGSVHAPCRSGARMGHPCAPGVGLCGGGVRGRTGSCQGA